ncbi:AAA family ATPase [candidate division KSB1 bacterium]|nr:AAA family ATPase [candidate division KSB1 bacterium]
MIENVYFKFGPNGGCDSLELEPSAMTLFVGPNNSGKSLILREIRNYIRSGPKTNFKIIDGIGVKIFSEKEVNSLLEECRSLLPPGKVLPQDSLRVSSFKPDDKTVESRDIDLKHLFHKLEEYRTRKESGIKEWWRMHPKVVFSDFISLFTVFFDGQVRLTLTQDHPAGDLQDNPGNYLVALFKNDTLRERVRKIIYEAFGFYFAIDPTHSGFLKIRMSKRPPSEPKEERALDSDAINFHSEATYIGEFGDGVKAFTGIISSLICSNHRIMLIDEPEAFLHPTLSRKLGREMANLANERSGHVFASTHSSHFLMGCIDSGQPINIVRLTYNEPIATARLLQSKKVKQLMRDPLLRSTKVLEALFTFGAVVCEGDSDRAFYDEVNCRLQMEERNAVPDSIFLIAQNKQTVRKIIKPLREMGIPAAAILDFDIFKNNDLPELLKACFVPSEIVHSLGQLRGDVVKHFEELDMKKGGIGLLSGGAVESCQSLLDQLAEYGVFVVPCGELENWLGYLEVKAPKNEWLPAMFDRMKSNPNDSDYVKPREGNVWEFIENISAWIKNERRKGMPRQESLGVQTI